MPHYWFSHWANSRRNVPNQRSEADITQPWPLLPAWHIEINVLPHKAAYSWASPLGGRINLTIFSYFFLSSSLSIWWVYKQMPFLRPPCTTIVLNFYFLKSQRVFFFFTLFPETCHVKSGGHGSLPLSQSGVSVGESCCATDTPSHR